MSEESFVLVDVYAVYDPDRLCINIAVLVRPVAVEEVDHLVDDALHHGWAEVDAHHIIEVLVGNLSLLLSLSAHDIIELLHTTDSGDVYVEALKLCLCSCGE